MGAACSISSSGSTSGGKGVVASGTFVIDNIDPGSAEGGAAGKELAGQQIYGHLLKPNATGTLVPDLAQSWRPNADATSWSSPCAAG